MAVTHQPVTLDADDADRDGLLVFRDGCLLAVLSRLSDMHGDLAGHWFIEATFGELPRHLTTFETLDRFDQWLTDATAPAAV